MFGYSHTIHEQVTGAGFTIIEKLTGHGVGVKVHEKPYIHNHPHHPETKQVTFQPGMVLAFEPITAIKSTDFELGKDNDRNLYTKK
jgi:methionyl aminopeptidase